MRLVRFGDPGFERPGVLCKEDPAEGCPQLAYDVGDYVGDYGAGFWAMGGPRIFDGLRLAGFPVVDLSCQRMAAPIAPPSKVICIGLNYHGHAKESNMATPSEPVVFMKASNTIVGPFDDVKIPPSSAKTDWEVELGIVVGERGRYLADEAAAARTIGGYVLSNDISEREYQLERGGQWDKGKSCETFNPLGPWLVPADAMPTPQDTSMWLDVNGERMQAGTTSDMVFSCEHIVWYLSQFMVLEPGDLINTGTPAGVGLARQQYFRVGDSMNLGAEHLGEQHHRCTAGGPMPVGGVDGDSDPRAAVSEMRRAVR